MSENLLELFDEEIEEKPMEKTIPEEEKQAAQPAPPAPPAASEEKVEVPSEKPKPRRRYTRRAKKIPEPATTQSVSTEPEKPVKQVHKDVAPTEPPKLKRQQATNVHEEKEEKPKAKPKPKRKINPHRKKTIRRVLEFLMDSDDSDDDLQQNSVKSHEKRTQGSVGKQRMQEPVQSHSQVPPRTAPAYPAHLAMFYE